MKFQELILLLISKLYECDKKYPGNNFNLFEIGKEIGENNENIICEVAKYLRDKNMIVMEEYLGGRCDIALTGEGRIYVENSTKKNNNDTIKNAINISNSPGAKVVTGNNAETVIKNTRFKEKVHRYFINLPFYKKVAWFVSVFIMTGIGIYELYLSFPKNGNQSNKSRVINNTKVQKMENSPGGVQITGNENTITLPIDNKKDSEKVIKAKIILLIETADTSKATTPYLSIEEIARRGEIEIRGALEQAVRQGGSSSGLIQAFSRTQYEELVRNLDGRMDILKSDIFDVMSKVGQTKLEEVSWLQEENEKFKKLKQKVESIKVDIKNSFNIKDKK